MIMNKLKFQFITNSRAFKLKPEHGAGVASAGELALQSPSEHSREEEHDDLDGE